MKYVRRIVLLLLLLPACAAVSLAQKNKAAAPPAKAQAKKPAPAPAPAAQAEREAVAANWKAFDSPAGGFSILFPDTPVEKTEAMGSVDAHVVSLQTFAEYSVMYADSPQPIADAAMAHRILDDGVKTAVDAQSQLLETKDISLEGNPGKYLKQRLADGKILRAKLILVGQRFYQIAITTPDEQGKTDESLKFYDSVASKYLDSFKLIVRSVK